MKYLRYIGILLFKLFNKVFGLFWFWVAVPFRAYARNTVYNYVLENNVHLPRLYDRNPNLIGDCYYLDDIHGVSVNNDIELQGKIKYRKVSAVEYYIVLFLLWGWVDDDSNHDTMSGGKREGMVYGNTFDLGDTRGEYPQLNFKESALWLIRNTAYNFNYMLEEIAKDSPMYFYVRFPSIGWHFGYISYSNPTRKGRMVWFTEDYDKVVK